MPRVRFERLDPAQQAVILDAALREFSTDGYAEASLNRIIAAAGLSKGAMYYYFEDKADLYLYVVSTQMARLAGSPADLEFLRARSADDFWSMLESDSIRLLIRLSELPDVAAVLRDAIAGTGAAVMRRVGGEVEAVTQSWIERAIGYGQQRGAIRADVPIGLLGAVAGAMMNAMDAWYLSRRDVAHPDRRVVHDFIGMLRRALQP